MRLFIVLFLLSFVRVAAQPSTVRPHMDVKAAYELSLREFMKSHSEAIYKGKGGTKVLFVKKQAFTDNFKDTLDGVTVKIIELPKDVEVIAGYVKKKTVLSILNLNQMILRDINAQVWIMPMKAEFNPKKKTLEEPVYEDKGCEFIYDYSMGSNSEFLFKEWNCRDL
jgi:hypothetical protein